MSTLLQNTKTELRAAGLFDPDADFDGAVATCVTSLMETLVAYGHSGESLKQTVAIFTRLASHKPITPLTGEDDEWTELQGLWQNNRCPTVFKDKNRAFDTALECGTKSITFPYVPA